MSDFNQTIEQINDLIEQGITYEENFISGYANILKSDDYLSFFHHQERVVELLNYLITESEHHLENLQSIKKDIEHYGLI